jgi:amidase
VDGADLAFAGLARQAELIRDGEVSSRELTEIYLERISRLDPILNAFTVVLGERALAEAAEADRRRAAGSGEPLLGVPVAIKDVEDVEGVVTAFGTAAFERPAAADGELVRRLRAAGAVIIGKTALPELAILPFTESRRWGVTRNPWDTERTPGGSSGGSGAAVAAGLVGAATASDGGGSIRIPAAFCGLFGLKPQRGRLPLTPADHWWDLSVHGCLTRGVLDTALFLDATVGGRAAAGGPPPPDRPYAEAARSRPARLRIAVSDRPARAVMPPTVSDEVLAGLAETEALLRSLGHRVERADPGFGNAGNNFVPRYLRGIHDEVEGVEHAERLERRTRGFARLGALYHPALVRRARRAADRDAERINRVFDRCDVLVTPTTGELSVELDRWRDKGALRTLLGISRTYCFTPVWNHTGQPAAAVPAGFSATGLPRSVSLVSRPGGEPTLISLAAQIEAERPWAQRRPPVS